MSETEKYFESKAGDISVGVVESVQLSTDEELSGAAGNGYKSELRREFGLFAAFSFAFSVSGLFGTIGTTFFYPLMAGGAACTVWMWFVTGIGCMCIALSVAELTSAYPTSGSLYYCCSRVVPERWGPSLAWTDGWINLLGQFAGLSSTIYGTASILLETVAMGTDFTYEPTTNHVVGVQAALLAFIGIVNTLPTKWLERTTKWYVVIHISLLVSGSVALLATTFPKHEASYVFTHVEANSGWSPVGFSFIFGALECSWVMTGYTATSQISDELLNPAITAPWALSLAMAATWVLGFLYNIVLAFCMGDPAYIMSQTQPVAMIYYNSMGKKAGIFFSVAMLLVNIFVGITGAQANARTVWVQARDGMYPLVGKWFTIVNSYTRTPVNAVWITIAISIAINLIALASETAINAIFQVCAIALDWSYIIPICAKLIFDEYRPGPWSLGKYSVPVNIWSVAWTVFISVIFFMPTNLPVDAQTMNYAVVFFFGVIGISVALWYAGGKKLYKGPKAVKMRPEEALVASCEVQGKSSEKSPFV